MAIEHLIVPVSGGKDSTACLIKALNEYPNAEIIPVFNDTGWDHPHTYEYLDYLEKRLNVSIIRTVGGQRKDGTPIPTLVDVIRAQGKFPFGMGRFCTTYLKQNTLRDYYKNYLYDGETHYRVWFGMRSDESNQRARRYSGIEPDDVFSMNDIFPGRYNKKLDATLTVSLPILDWITDEVFRYLEMNNVEYNPLYDEGTNDRVGCYPCMLASKKVQSRMFETDFGKQQLQIIKDLEQELGVKYEMYDTDQGSCEACNI